MDKATSVVGYTTSRHLAEALKTKHKQILRSIDREIEGLEVECKQHPQMLENFLAGFTHNTYTDRSNREQREYLLSEEAAAMVVAKYGALGRAVVATKGKQDLLQRVRQVFGSEDSKGQEKHIYVLWDPVSKKSKIGISKHPEKRLSAIKSHVGSAVLYWQSELRGDAEAIEQSVHSHLRKHRSHGEWFALKPQRAVDHVMQLLAKC